MYSHSKEIWTSANAPLLYIYDIHVLLKGLIYKNLQNAAEGGMAPRQMIPTAVICCP